MDSERVLVWKWPDRPSSAIMLAAVSGRSAAGTPRTTGIPYVSCRGSRFSAVHLHRRGMPSV